MAEPDMLSKALTDAGITKVEDGGRCEKCVIYRACQKDAEDKSRTGKSFRSICTEEIGQDYTLLSTKEIENQEELFQMLLTIANIRRLHG